VIRNNLATDYSIEGNTLTQDHNTTLEDLAAYFVDPVHFDLHLKPGAPAIDQASNDDAPALDADRIARPQGSAVDLGAYEWHEPNVKPVEAGTGGSGAPPSAAGQAAPPPPNAGRGGGGGGRAGATVGGGDAGRAGVGGRGGSGGETRREAGTNDAPDGGNATTSSDDGCGCRLSNRQSDQSTTALAVFLGLLAIRIGRRRRRPENRSKQNA
jgi:MYXO-CTERM domain-containing protein